MFTKSQWIGHCGPTSLSYCLYFLTGERVSQRVLASRAGRPWSTFWEGIDEFEICKAARAYKLKSSRLRVNGKENGRQFLKSLLRHLRLKGPAVLSIDDGSHWVAVLGFLPGPGKFVVVDPADLKVVFSRWGERTLLSRAWDHDDEDYLAVVLQRRDGFPPEFRVEDLGKYRG